MTLDPSTHRLLRDALSCLLYSPELILQIAGDAGIDRSRINGRQAPEMVWNEVLQEASRQSDEMTIELLKICVARAPSLLVNGPISQLICGRTPLASNPTFQTAGGSSGRRAPSTAATSTVQAPMSSQTPAVFPSADKVAAGLHTGTLAGCVQEGFSLKAPAHSRAPAPKNALLSLVVDALHRGDYPTLAGALDAADTGTRILVRPGLYRESVVIDKPVEIIGDGGAGIVIEASGKSAVSFKTSMGRMVNLTLRQTDHRCCVDISEGRLELEGCDISCQGGVGVMISGGADPYLRHNRIHDVDVGVFVHENGRGTLEDNEICDTQTAGVTTCEYGNPTLLRNRIYGGKRCGVLVANNGRGTLEDNEIFSNDLGGIEIFGGGNPTLRRNRIHCELGYGVKVSGGGLGSLEDNEIFASSPGVLICPGGSPTLRHNRISKNIGYGVMILNDGCGLFEGNELRGNSEGAWFIFPGAESRVRRTANRE